MVWALRQLLLLLLLNWPDGALCQPSGPRWAPKSKRQVALAANAWRQESCIRGAWSIYMDTEVTRALAPTAHRWRGWQGPVVRFLEDHRPPSCRPIRMGVLSLPETYWTAMLMGVGKIWSGTWHMGRYPGIFARGHVGPVLRP